MMTFLQNYILFALNILGKVNFISSKFYENKKQECNTTSYKNNFHFNNSVFLIKQLLTKFLANHFFFFKILQNNPITKKEMKAI